MTDAMKDLIERRTLAHGTARDQHGQKFYFTKDKVLHTERRGVQEPTMTDKAAPQRGNTK